MAWPRRNVPIVLLGGALLAAAVLLLALTHGMTYFQDTWEFLMNRRHLTADALLQPHNEHIVLLPVTIELILVHVFGMSSALPEYALLTAMLLVSAALFFVYVRRRVGDWLALMASALLLFVGPAWQDLLWPFEMAFVGSILFGIAMLLALDRDDRRGDVAACVFLALSAAFSSLGVTFMAAAAVNFLQRRRDRGAGRIWFVAVPVVLFAIWYAGWGHDAESHLSLRNVLDSPRFVLEGLAASIESVLGLSGAPIEGTATVTWGQPLLIGGIGLIAYRQIRKPGFSPGFWPIAAATATNWFLTAFNYVPGREPTTGRYMYAAAVFILLLAAELLRDLRFGRRALWVAGAVTIAAVASNMHFFRDGADWLKNQTVLTRSDLAAIEISRRTIPPSFELSPVVAGTPSLIDVFAGEYLQAEHEFGSPAYSTAELLDAPEVGRRQADVILSQTLPLSTVTETGAMDTGGAACTLVTGEGAPADLPVEPGVTRIVVAPGPHASFSLRRFAAAEYPVPTEGAPGESTTLLTVPHDTAAVPWRLHVEAAQPVRVCR